MKVVVVESPAKAKTINNYLGAGHKVLASFGHIRDLPPKDGSVRPDDDFAMDWETDPKAEKHIKEIVSALKNAETLILATDPDREGEAISWHIQKVLEQRKSLRQIKVQRVVFNEITKTAILEAMKNPRDLDQELVDAYLARRALDYLVGFTISPVLWRKLPGSRSAGRVQSVALRLICERESEIEQFRSKEYWTIEADFATEQKNLLTANLVMTDGKKLDKFDIPNESTARSVEQMVNANDYHVEKIERKQVKRHPFAPFTTSTLQQEASHKLHFSASHTMRIAQKLYEGVDIGGETVGLITYMRTDGIQMAGEAIAAVRNLIGQQYEPSFLPKSPRVFKNKNKSAQEAHEAIRPTDIFRRPESLSRYLDRDQLRLYELIWLRTVACQMESAIIDQVGVDIFSRDMKTAFRATGSVLKFKGFLAVYKENHDDQSDETTDRILPDVTEGDLLSREETRCNQHFTQPPPRFSEASLVKRMEELGIGRPSTYASILSVLQERNYVRLDARRFIPEDRGRIVTAFLENFFLRYIQYNFTADLENKLDEIADGRAAWKSVLHAFWQDFSAAIEGTKELKISEVLEKLDETLKNHFFPQTDENIDPCLCTTCNHGRLGLRLGKFGAFIGCSDYPECRFTRQLSLAENGDSVGNNGGEARILGEDQESKLPVSLRSGPFGHYIQLGDGLDKKAKPKRVSLPRNIEPSMINLDKAVRLLSLPRILGNHPESGQPISAGIGKFGPYLKHGSSFKSLPKDDDVLEIGMNRAVELLASSPAKALAEVLGNHPDGKPVTFAKGRYGYYVSHNKINANLPSGKDSVTLEEALELLSAKAGKQTKKPVKKTVKLKK